MSEKNNDIETAATEPERITVDGQSVTNRTIAELIEADKYKKSQNVNPFHVFANNSRKASH